MRHHTIILPLSLAALLCGGCSESKNVPAPQSGGTPAAANDHDGHDHDGHGHGKEESLGTITLEGATLAVTQDGAVAAGKEASFDFTVTGATPTAIRVWLGAEDGSGSTKAKAEKEGEGFHVHVDAPASLAADAKLWIEVELADGKKATGSIAIHR
ncbi:MAG: hypothetical protein JNL80_14030 [Phycisphaerae bacterium]|jgi:hypothetical protein|nr:hypothetical protein [Phycisphaerae bacterium]